MSNIRRNCYWYYEHEDMQATVPICEYYGKYAYCPCDTDCKHFISKKETDNIIRKKCGGGET